MPLNKVCLISGMKSTEFLKNHLTVIRISPEKFYNKYAQFKLHLLPLENMVNTSSQLENSVRNHFQVVFTSGELGNIKASPFVPLGILDLVSSLFGPKYAENCL